MDMNLSKLQEIVKGREAWHAAIHRVKKSWTWLSGWITTTTYSRWMWLQVGWFSVPFLLPPTSSILHPSRAYMVAPVSGKTWKLLGSEKNTPEQLTRLLPRLLDGPVPLGVSWIWSEDPSVFWRSQFRWSWGSRILRKLLLVLLPLWVR